MTRKNKDRQGKTRNDKDRQGKTRKEEKRKGKTRKDKDLAGVKTNGVAGIWGVLVRAGVQDVVQSVGNH